MYKIGKERSKTSYRSKTESEIEDAQTNVGYGIEYDWYCSGRRESFFFYLPFRVEKVQVPIGCTHAHCIPRLVNPRFGEISMQLDLRSVTTWHASVRAK